MTDDWMPEDPFASPDDPAAREREQRRLEREEKRRKREEKPSKGEQERGQAGGEGRHCEWSLGGGLAVTNCGRFRRVLPRGSRRSACG